MLVIIIGIVLENYIVKPTETNLSSEQIAKNQAKLQNSDPWKKGWFVQTSRIVTYDSPPKRLHYLCLLAHYLPKKGGVLNFNNFHLLFLQTAGNSVT